MTWGTVFPYKRREGEDLATKVARLRYEAAELDRLKVRQMRGMDHTEPRSDDDVQA